MVAESPGQTSSSLAHFAEQFTDISAEWLTSDHTRVVPFSARVSDGLTFTVDETVLGTAAPPEGGFWEMGGFDADTWRNNPWQGRSKMAPFDQPVTTDPMVV